MSPLLKATLPLVLTGLLAGCLSPLDQCLVQAGQEARDIRRDLDASRNAVRYGYRIERVTVPELVPSVCVGAGGVAEPCMHWSHEPREIRHPINRANERERVELLERQLARAERREAQAATQCRATYPAE